MKPLLSGAALHAMGIPRGKRLGEVLGRLQHAKLDGEVKTRKDEEELVRDWMAKS